MNTTTATNIEVAKPETGSVKKVAWCKNCQEQIESTGISNGWYHPYTGYAECGTGSR